MLTAALGQAAQALHLLTTLHICTYPVEHLIGRATIKADEIYQQVACAAAPVVGIGINDPLTWPAANTVHLLKAWTLVYTLVRRLLNKTRLAQQRIGMKDLASASFAPGCLHARSCMHRAMRRERCTSIDPVGFQCWWKESCEQMVLQIPLVCDACQLPLHITQRLLLKEVTRWWLLACLCEVVPNRCWACICELLATYHCDSMAA